MGRTEPGPNGQLLAQAAFLLAANPWPDRGDSKVNAYINNAKTSARDWVYHLAVYRSAEGLVSEVPKYDSGRMMRQAEALARFTGLSTPSGLVLRAREYIVDKFDPDATSPWILGQPEVFDGESHGLTITMLLLAALHNKSLPSWAVFSGKVPDGTTRVVAIRRLAEKIDITLGESSRGRPIREVVEAMYRHQATPDRLGPANHRVVPGGVHLMVVPRETLDRSLRRDDLASSGVENISERFSLQPRRLREMASWTQEERKEYFREEARGGVIVVGVDDVFQAGALVGLPQPEPAAELELAAIRVKAGKWDEAAGPIVMIDLNALHRAAIRRMLQVLHMHCDRDDSAGLTLHVALLNPNAELPRLRLFESYGARVRAIPEEYPGDVDLVAEVLDGGATVAESRLSQNPRHRETIHSRDRIANRHRDLDVNGYLDFLEKACSCVVVPIKNGDRPIGVLALHGDREFEVDDHGRAILERFAGDLFAPRVHSVRESMRISERRSAIQHDLAKAIGRKPSLKDYVECVESLIKQHFGASRASLRLLYPAKDVLASPFDPEIRGYKHREIHLSADTAASFAVRIAQSYPIRDVLAPLVCNPATGNMEVIHYYNDDINMFSHYALLLKDNSHIIGVISISWHNVNAFTDRDVLDLEFLASESSSPIKWLKTTTERLLELEQMLKLPAPGENPDPDVRGQLERALPLVTEMIGARSAALYLPERSDGRLGLACHHNHDPEFVAELAAFHFERGEGLVGWIFKYRLSLNLCDVLNECELAEIPGKLRVADLPQIDPPVWKHFKHFDKKPQSYLGVPIIMGDEVFGVLRFLKDATPDGFSYQDQQTMEQVAGRISHYYYLSHIQPIRAGAYTRLNCTITRPMATRVELAREIFEIIDEGLGKCDCGLRILDETPLSGPPGMRLIATNEPEWLAQLPVYRRPGDPMIGDVWRKGEPRFVEDTAILREKATLAGKTTDWFVEKYQTMACFPLFAGPRDARLTVVGVLTIARDRRYTISAGDRRFLNRVAEIAGPYLVKVEADEETRFRLAVIDAALGRDGRHPVCALLEPIKAFAEVDSAWAWRARPDGVGYKMTCLGNHLLPGTSLDADTLHRLMASPLAQARSLAPLVPEDQPRQGAVVALRQQDGRIAAAFGLIPRQERNFDSGRIAKIQDILDGYIKAFQYYDPDNS